MHAKPEQSKTSIVPALFKVLVGTIGIFAIMTVCFYHNELDVDGNLTVGFPWIFYREGSGYSLDLNEQVGYHEFEPLKLIGNILFAATLYLLILWIYSAFSGKPKQ
ncbi:MULTISPECIES: hypothetical protein [Sphingobacterium]|uniref:Uncharacterized protein n=1 Tax=Sphingobacterium multivorum TaxID=28454 RepID=A0A2X2ISG1_SPHMU|nr:MULTISPECIES: hypothetical protein [Sphingobacterium]MBB1645991.1 hypothetical protein [Sphingobacterium sp. UME9]OFV17666.1 hypothetical protein HMPREF3127_08130 [Sphingobacterium sp. HMSC13C05]QRQ61665.1 hypothetical protein I6J33_01295 [Sphingobacterium multivorum]SPZ84234.1 Uncharacterised protein [Sphingobacterium multivorum]